MKSSEAIQIGKAALEDLPEILSLQKKAYLSEAEIYNDYSIPPLIQDLISLTKELEQGIFLKATLGPEIIGSIRAYKLQDTCFISKLIVDDNHQNKGIGTALMKSIEEEFSNASRYELFTGNKSKKNLYLYRKLGYNEFSNKIINETLTLIYLEKLKSGTTFKP
jgi:GNAT superfamily N-acetyltransferase